MNVADAWDVLSSDGRMLCHDLKQPVAAILVVASEAARLPATEMSDEVRARLRQIEEQAELLAEVIDATLAPAATDEEVDARGRELDVTLVEAVALTRLTYTGRVVLDHDAARARVSLGHVLVRRVLGNILDNATRAAGSDGTLWVSSHRSPGRVLVDVDDDGPGWGQVPPGQGLGLAFVSAVMETAGGAVSAGALSGGGTRVRLEFPIAAETG